MPKEQLLVSIVTPSYNQGQFIEQTILSVKNQDYPNIEHIIVDGGSTDNTLAILKKYEGAYNMRWISEPDEGQADAISKGFSLTRGNIVAWINSDDIYISKSVISLIVDLFEKYPDADVITGGGILMSEEGYWIQPIQMVEKRICYKHLRYGDSILQPATFMRKHVIEKVPLDKSLVYAFDWDFFIRVAQQFNILPVNCIIAGYRMYGRNKTAAGGPRRAKELLEVTGRYLGKVSWQYYVVLWFYILYRFAELLPGRLRMVSFWVFRKLSIIVSVVTFRRVPPV